ncbi:WhiB family transcriptional regulator [Mycolicibacterium sphagni]|uniref:4Fe-4S Wbl-type domain-containing protein n=1 Tax=Mycolicibacterium sphagni TaxID=1786 RepID=A0A255DQL0_9MYCO|nr:WhiB family transcriptional regulator [Mycolicibacterium sphagni]OYN81729.1 hypothetical protein CG716_05080 [Mycolicibacterium sphagni]
MTTPELRWWELAECQYIGIEAFYAEGQGHKMTEAKKICAGCPVVSECLEAALIEESGLDYNHRFGMRGALSPRERWALAKERGEDTEFDNGEPVYWPVEMEPVYWPVELEVA